MEQLLTLSEVAKMLGICRNTASKMALPSVKLHPRGHKLYCESDIIKFIDNSKISVDEIIDSLDFTRVMKRRRK